MIVTNEAFEKQMERFSYMLNLQTVKQEHLDWAVKAALRRGTEVNHTTIYAALETDRSSVRRQVDVLCNAERNRAVANCRRNIYTLVDQIVTGEPMESLAPMLEDINRWVREAREKAK